MKTMPSISTSLIWPLFLLCLLSSCEEGFRNNGNGDSAEARTSVEISLAEVRTALENRLASTADSLCCIQDTLHQDSLMAAQIRCFYAAKQFEPLWLDEHGISELGEAYLKQLAELKFDGLNPADYDPFQVDPGNEKFRSGKTLSAAEWAAFDHCLTSSFFKASHDLVMGRYYQVNRKHKDWKHINDSSFSETEALQKSLLARDMQEAFNYMRPKHPWYRQFRAEFRRLDSLKGLGDSARVVNLKDSLAIGFSSPEVAVLRRRLQVDMDLPVDTPMMVCDSALIDLIKAFQYRRQLKVSGKLDTATLNRLHRSVETKQRMLALNMERLRWMQHDFPQPYIWTVIPRMDVEYVEHDSVQFRMRAVVGRAARPTPNLNTRLEQVVLSPPWVVPPTILREDVLPGIARRGGAYLARKGLRAYDRRGRPVSASAINAGNYRSFSISQAPGYSSSLGEVKFNMPNPWSVYMHDTPHREDFVKYFRALSSGCVRVHKPKEFATFLLRDSSNYSYAQIDSLCKLRKTIFVPMKRTVYVHFVYLTNAIDSTGHLMYLNDIYNWDSKVKGWQ